MKFNDHEALQTLFSDPEVQQKLRDIQAKRAPKIDKDEIIDMVARASAQATAKAMVDFKQFVTDELAASIVKAWNKDSEEGHPPPGLESKHRYDKPVSSHDIVEGTLPTGEKIDHWVPKYKFMYDRPMVSQQRIANDSIRAGELSWGIGHNMEPTQVRITSCNYAFVTLLYGNKPDVLAQTLMLGYMLRTLHDKNKYDVVVMTTPEVEPEPLRLLSVFFTIMKVKPIYPKDESWEKNMNTHKREKWAMVWTKFWALHLTQYDKILLLDSDIMIRKELGYIFQMDAPAGAVWNSQLKYRPGQKINRGELIKKVDGLLVTKLSINAGCMLLKPNVGDVNNFLNHIKREPNRVTQGFMPEQEAMSAFYQWHNIGHDNFSPSFLRKETDTLRDCPHAVAEVITQAGVIHFAGQWGITNYQNWAYYDVPPFANGPGIPHRPAEGLPTQIFHKIYNEYEQWIDDLMINPLVWDNIKIVIDKIDVRHNKNQGGTNQGPFSEVDNQGKLLTCTVAVIPGRSYKVCMAYNSAGGCTTIGCDLLHRCRHSKCNLAAHPYDPMTCPRI